MLATAPNYKDLILEGERIRETVDPKKAIPVFQRALEAASKPSQVSNGKRHLGLCYEHLGDLDNAEILYKEAMQSASGSNDIGDIARAKRHILSIEVKRGNIVKAVSLGTEARCLMLSLENVPTDLVWITHGIAKALVISCAPKTEVRYWTKLEWKDLKQCWSQETNTIKKRVWLTGFLLDAAYAWAPLSLPLFGLAFVISLFSGLKIRLRHLFKGNW